MDSLNLELRCALDPVTFAIERLDFQPDPWQAKVLRLSDKNTLLNCSRQSGKSTIAAIIALHRAVYWPKSLILLGSPSLRQSKELFGKVVGFLRCLKNQPSLIEDNKLSIELENGSRVVSLPGEEKTVRGFSDPALIIEDESSRVKDEFNRAVRPMLAVSDGRLILMSTPYGKRGHFHEAWTSQTEEWERFEVTANQCPRITDSFLKRERAALGEWYFRQEYLCEFIETIDAVFRAADIERAFTDEVKPLFPGAAPDNEVTPLFEVAP